MLLKISVITLNSFGIPRLVQGKKARADAGTTMRLQAIAEHMNELEVDVVLFQEIFLYRYLSLFKRLLSRFPHCAYERSIAGPMGGLVIFAQMPIQRMEYIVYKPRGFGFRRTLIDWGMRKGFLAVEIEQDGVPILVINTHLVTNFDHDWSDQNYYAQQEHRELEQLLTYIERLDSGPLLILGGDFNVPKSTKLYDDFVNDAKVIDALPDPNVPTHRRGGPLSSDTRMAGIDYILVRPPVETKVSIVGKPILQEKVQLRNGQMAFVSDHVGIQA